MKLPHVAIAVDENTEQLMFEHAKAGERAPLQVEMELGTLGSAGFDHACRDIGSVVLGLMGLWYPLTMAKHPDLKRPYSAQRDIDLIDSLVSKCVTGRTGAHLQSLDLLIQEVLENEPAFAATTFMEVWPDLRKRIAAY